MCQKNRMKLKTAAIRSQKATALMMSYNNALFDCCNDARRLRSRATEATVDSVAHRQESAFPTSSMLRDQSQSPLDSMFDEVGIDQCA